MIERPITVVENPDSIPELGLLLVVNMCLTKKGLKLSYFGVSEVI